MSETKLYSVLMVSTRTQEPDYLISLFRTKKEALEYAVKIAAEYYPEVTLADIEGAYSENVQYPEERKADEHFYVSAVQPPKAPKAKVAKKVAKSKKAKAKVAKKAKKVVKPPAKTVDVLPTKEEYEAMTLPELKKECKKYNLTGESLARTTEGKRADLIEMLGHVRVGPDDSLPQYRGPTYSIPKEPLDYTNMTVAELKFAIDLKNQGRKPKDAITKTGTKLQLIEKLQREK